MLDAHGLRSLTRLLKEAKKKRFAAANKRFLDIAAGPLQTPVYLLDETLDRRKYADLAICKRPHGVQDFPCLEGIRDLRDISHDGEIPRRGLCQRSQ